MQISKYEKRKKKHFEVQFIALFMEIGVDFIEEGVYGV